jgi:AraC-like DNA-binding protein
MSFARGAEGMWICVADSFFHAQVVPALPACSTPNSSYWKEFYVLAAVDYFCGPRNYKVRSRLMSELRFARTRLGIGADPAVMGYVVLMLYEPPWRSWHERATRRGAVPLSEALAATREILASFRALVEENYRRHLPIADYCKMLGVTPRHLTDACRAMTGLTPLGMLHERLVLAARTRLLYSSAAIKEISYDLGFEDVSYFSRFFRRQTGKRPADLRRGALELLSEVVA